MRPTEILTAEHRVIERVLTCLERMAGRARGDARIDVESAREAIDFLRGFADRCHHAKEEEQLFPLMEANGFSPHQGPTAVMRHEHTVGRELIARMDEAVAREEVGTFGTAVDAYVALLREHIRKEDHCLFPMADQTLDAAQHEALLRSFETVEREEIGEGVHERYLAIAERLGERFGVPAPSGSTAPTTACGPA